MQIVNIHEAKSQLSKLVGLAVGGEEIVICKAGKPLVSLKKYIKEDQPRTPGYWKGKIQISEDFDVLPDSLAAAFRGKAE